MKAFLTVIVIVVDNDCDGFLFSYSMHSISFDFGANCLGGDVVEVDDNNCVALLHLDFLQNLFFS